MSNTPKDVSQLLGEQFKSRAELVKIGRQIEEAGQKLVVGFVDLVGSTALKHGQDASEWLGLIFTFIEGIQELAIAAGGTVIKLIGDELMLTFPSVDKSESFLASLINNSTLKEYQCKVALDFGTVYLLKVEGHIPHDPYGSVVDRCARVAKLAHPWTILCTDAYTKHVTTSCTDYVPVGPRALHGFEETTTLFARSLIEIDREKYLEPLIAAVNKVTEMITGYHVRGRKLTTALVREFQGLSGRPFLARELLNVPKLPHSAKNLRAEINTAGNPSQKENEFIGYLVEWEGRFQRFAVNKSCIIMTMEVKDSYQSIMLYLPLSYLEIAKLLKTHQTIRVRGIILEFYAGAPLLDYVDIDFDLLAESGTPAEK